MDGSNGKVIALLERIAMGVEATSERLDETNERLDETNERIERGFAAVNTRLDGVNARIENVIDFMSRSRTDHEQRIRALEERVFAKSG